MNAIAEFGQAAIARAEVRHAKAESLLWLAAGFTWDRRREVYAVDVCGLEVARFPDQFSTVQFVLTHNGRLSGTENAIL